MKLCALSPDMLHQLTNLLDQANPGQLWLEAPALAELRSTLSGPSFVPQVYVGIQGGLIQGATGNCNMRLVGGDYDVDGSNTSEQRFLRVFGSTVIPVEHQVLADADVCEALFTDALADENVAKDESTEGMAQ